MANLISITLVLSSVVMTHGLSLSAQRKHENTVDEKHGVDTGVDTNAALARESRALKDTVFDLAACVESMPYLQYTAYEAASFCRSYLYSCNNLWPEELNTEVQDASYCLINAYEKNIPEEQQKEKQLAFHKTMNTMIEPFYAFLNEWFRYTDKATYMDQSRDDPRDKAAGFLQCQDTSDNKCMIQSMKKMSKLRNSKPDLSRLTKDEALKLFDKAENVTKGLTSLQQAKLVWEPDTEGMTKAMNDLDIGKLLEKFPGLKKLGILDTSKPVAGPMNSSLGTLTYKNSEPHHVGPIAPKTRYPHDAVQDGLVMDIFDLSTMDARAICNDGSPGKMYLKENSKTKWHFHFDGGFFCYDKKSCMERAHYSTPMVSTRGYETSKNNSGMFDPIKGGFPDYTHAVAAYCSSDAWMGQIEIEDFQLVNGTILSNGKPGTYFHGYFILEAVLKKFIQMGMGDTKDQELWVSGCSAGSIAGTAMADSWQPRLRALGMKNDVKIWTMLDNAPILSPPAVPGNPSIFDMAMKLVDFLYGEGRNASPAAFINQKCVADLTAKNISANECVFPGTGILYIETPNLILNQIWDNFVTAKTYGFMHPVTPIHYQTGLEIAKRTKEIFKTVGPTQNYWAISCGDHCMSANPTFWRYIPNTAKEPLSARDMAIQTRDAAVYNKTKLLGRVVADECNDYNCGCIGQSVSVTKLALNSLYFKILERIAPAANPWKMIPSTISVTTGIAANQQESIGQFLFGP